MRSMAHCSLSRVGSSLSCHRKSPAGTVDLMNEITRILRKIEEGNPQAAAQLLPLMYDELRRLAAGHMANEAPYNTLNATALVHEAYLRLVGDDPTKPWDGRGHFFAAASEAMRRILVDRARRKKAEKHGGRLKRVQLGDVAGREPDSDLVALDEALTELQQHDEAAARLVTLRYFGGLGHQDAALAMGISRRAADRLWALARAWLYQRLGEIS
jgi:RNA polymerase sigma factor (TIGR02999 family)